MKRILILGLLALCLTGCSQEAMETVADSLAEPVSAPVQQVVLTLPDEAVQTVHSTEDGQIYLFDHYYVTVQTMPAGDLDATLRQLTGFSRSNLTVMTTQQGELKCYRSVWSSAGEGEEQVGRLMVLDDGSHHYALTVMADATAAAELADDWELILDSFRVVPQWEVNTAS